MLTPLTVAAVQAPSVPGDVAANARAAAELAGQAADRGARLCVLPELFLPAYHPPALADLVTDVAAEAGEVADARLDPVRAAARDRQIVILSGAAVRDEHDRRTCAIVVADGSGRVRVAYEKNFLCGPEEKALFVPGSQGATLHVDGWRLGLGVCYDGCFPEHARAAQADEVHGMVYPAAYVTGSEHRRDVYYAARALDNTGYVVYANAVDGAAPWTFNGGAAVYDPEGRAVVRGPNSGTSVLVATLSPEALAETRAGHTMLTDRPMQMSNDAVATRAQVYT
ncbi:MAG: carbon-nitrogen hydrolase family protein [Hamadaea sp.]|uniref:carbon-nitrogen hydrolase family protein n=1 Tax=Hamadaea sp. TaxID=2024425 RepID=UPI00180C6792|nr:carbon-nitrogen hydrolase family protein [Hamadaea sp.]NUT18291.1 carbon-nitrogen hydrolase family protein [Hamadaea sp.]